MGDWLLSEPLEPCCGVNGPSSITSLPALLVTLVFHPSALHVPSVPVPHSPPSLLGIVTLPLLPGSPPGTLPLPIIMFQAVPSCCVPLEWAQHPDLVSQTPCLSKTTNHSGVDSRVFPCVALTLFVQILYRQREPPGLRVLAGPDRQISYHCSSARTRTKTSEPSSVHGGLGMLTLSKWMIVCYIVLNERFLSLFLWLL